MSIRIKRGIHSLQGIAAKVMIAMLLIATFQDGIPAHAVVSQVITGTVEAEDDTVQADGASQTTVSLQLTDQAGNYVTLPPIR